MNLNQNTAVAFGAALVLAGGAAGGALAAGSSARATSHHPRAFLRHHRVLGLDVVQAVAGYVNLTPQQLVDQLRSGKSLANVATAQGKTVDGLKQTILDAVKKRLDTAVTRNRITSAQEQTTLDRVKARLDAIVNATRPVRPQAPFVGLRGLRGLLGVATTYLGLTPQQLADQLHGGKSLADVATAQGKSADGLKQALVAAVKARLDQAVSANRLSSAQEQTFLSQLQTRLDTVVNQHFGLHSA